MAKAIILYTSKSCALCNEVELIAEDISEKTKIPMYKVDADELPEKPETPMTCVAILKDKSTEIKDQNCFIGWEDYENRLLELLTKG